jgi:hypothetical protein
MTTGAAEEQHDKGEQERVSNALPLRHDRNGNCPTSASELPSPV